MIIFSTCAIAGLSEAICVILILDAVHSEPFALRYLTMLPFAGISFVFSAYVYNKRASVLAEKTMEKMTVDLCNRIRLSKLPNIEKIGKSDVYTHLWDARMVTNAIMKSLFLIHRGVAILAIWIYIWGTHPFWGMVVAIYGLFYLLVYEQFQSLLKSAVDVENRIIKALFAAFDHILHGFKEIRLNRRKSDDLSDNHILPLIEKTETVRVQSGRYVAELFRFHELSILVLACISALTLSTYFKSALTVTMLFFYMREPLSLIVLGIPEIIDGKAAMARLHQLTEQLGKPKPVVPVSHGEPIRDFRTIMLEKIGFAYEGEEGFALGPLDLRIQAGEILFIVGGNGSGKSTLMKLMCGLYVPSSGRITVDHVPVNMEDHRHLFSTVFTDFHLFDSLYGIEHDRRHSVDDLLDQFELSGKTRFSDGRFTKLDLSTGQKKRLAFIVAMLEDRPIYIFDEWAADQDPQFRRHFYVNLLPSLKARGKTIIAVTHDDNYFHIADRVVKLEYGKIGRLADSHP